MPSTDPTQPRLDQASLNAILHAVATCERLMIEFKSKLSPYEQSLVQGDSGNWFLEFRRKIGWMPLICAGIWSLRVM
ncbi:hypothetical protein PHLCEN_2v12244 [Hermanssonia centrifuga]|uniref:Uncharacterized protein n=1 Tax=Hermanssonia centrifuga TaxID=98765 RepID=A0A2R6NHQ5_9APHY|nr:hypothetical protein PHLCEN_2v12244 [Hermanssonia centrifuga]